MQNYFNQPTFGNSKTKMVEDRLKYNSEKLGDIVFAIYTKQPNGELELYDVTSKNTYTYVGYGNATIVIKAKYEKFESNASNGIEITASLEELNTSKIVAKLKGGNILTGNSVTTTVGTYKEEGFESIKYDNINILKSVNITYTVSGNIDDVFNKDVELQTYINTLPAGTYTITYTINYLGQKVTKTRTVELLPLS